MSNTRKETTRRKAGADSSKKKESDAGQGSLQAEEPRYRKLKTKLLAATTSLVLALAAWAWTQSKEARNDLKSSTPGTIAGVVKPPAVTEKIKKQPVKDDEDEKVADALAARGIVTKSKNAAIFYKAVNPEIQVGDR
jgi:hypothetical protein